MQVTLLGTGLPIPNPHRRGPSSLVTAGDHRCLIDCGSGVVHQLVQARTSPGAVDHLFLTHLHSDHFIDLGHFVVLRWITGEDRPLYLYGPKGTKFLAEKTLEILEPDIRLRMKIRREPREMPMIEVTEIDQGKICELDGLGVSAFDVEHFPLEQPFGYRFDTRGPQHRDLRRHLPVREPDPPRPWGRSAGARMYRGRDLAGSADRSQPDQPIAHRPRQAGHRRHRGGTRHAGDDPHEPGLGAAGAPGADRPGFQRPDRDRRGPADRLKRKRARRFQFRRNRPSPPPGHPIRSRGWPGGGEGRRDST